MRPAAHVQATIELLDQLNETSYPADRVMASYFRQRRYIGSKDKAAISENFYHILRNLLSYQYLLADVGFDSQSDFGAYQNSRLIAAVKTKLDGTHIAQVFNGEQYSPNSFTPEQLTKLEKINAAQLFHAPSHVRLNVPKWLETPLKTALRECYEAEIEASNLRAHTDIRVNTLKRSRDQLKTMLGEAGYNAEATPLSPWGLSFSGRVALSATQAFKDGYFEIQDQGSQLLALLTAVKAGDKVVDFCAGAGGKTLAMAAMMQNKGVLYACDVHSKRLAQLGKRAKRAGAHNIQAKLLKSENDKWVKRHQNFADVVLLDAPCSGTGTWRRNPDSRWNLQAAHLQNLTDLQLSIMRSAKRLVKPGGRFLYATCSLLIEENEQVVTHFLQENRNFAPLDFSLPASLEAHSARYLLNGHQFRTSPGLSDTDGFFVACLIRTK